MMVCARSRKVVRKFCASICIKTLGGARYAQAQRKVPTKTRKDVIFIQRILNNAHIYIYICVPKKIHIDCVFSKGFHIFETSLTILR